MRQICLFQAASEYKSQHSLFGITSIVVDLPRARNYGTPGVHEAFKSLIYAPATGVRDGIISMGQCKKVATPER